MDNTPSNFTNTCFGGRLSYVDAQKGILILLVVFHHINNYAHSLNIEIDEIDMVFKANYLFVGFFMQAFFFLTGYVSSFNKKFTVFIKNNAKALLLPILFFWLINSSVETYFSHIKDSMMYVTIDNQKIPLLFETMWFLQALFIAKVLLWLINRYAKKTIIQIAIVVTLLVLGSILNDFLGHYNNWLHYRNALCMVFMMFMGFYLKKQTQLMVKVEKLRYVILLLYLIPTLLLATKDMTISYTHMQYFSTKYLVAYLYLSSMGTLAFFCCLKKNNSRFLEYLGKNSLIIYGVHFVFLQFLEVILLRFFSLNGWMNEFIYLIIVYCGSVLLCLASCLFLNRKPFCYLVGKF